jgi:predicted acetyltransferase
MAQEWRDAGEDRYGLALADFDGYLMRTRRREELEQPQGRVPSSEFWLVSGSRVVGCVRLRHRLTPELEVEGGHIGYDVRPSARGHGFGTAALRLALNTARDRGLERVRVTTDADNVASVKVIERNGGILEGQSTSVRSGKPIRQYAIELGRC